MAAQTIIRQPRPRDHWSRLYKWTNRDRLSLIRGLDTIAPAMVDAAPQARKSDRRWSDIAILVVIVLIAACFRLPSLDSQGYELDEFWTAEVASGRGSLHVDFPVNQILKAPEFFKLNDAPPWWHVWTHMQVTHPPLYYITLRLWMNLFGQGDWNERLYSVIASLVAIAILYDAARLTSGRGVAFWACLLMAVAPLQIEYARKTRNYAMELVVLLAAVDVMIRIEQFGMTRRRWVALMLGALCVPLTHYFAIGVDIALAIFAVCRLKGRARTQSLVAFAIAAVIFAIIWGPFFYRQRALFSIDDPGVSFAKDTKPHHLWNVIDMMLLVPAKMLVPHLHLPLIAYVMSLFFVLPFLLRRSRPDLLIWSLLLCGIIGVVTLLDLTHSSLHLGFVRYILFAGPAVYMLIPAIASHSWAKHAMPMAAVLICLYWVRGAYESPAANPHAMVDFIRPSIGPDDIVAFASAGDLFWTRGPQAMLLLRYDDPLPCPVVFLDRPISGELQAQLRAARSVILFSSAVPAQFFLPDFSIRHSESFYYWGTVSVMTPTAKSK